MAEQRPKIELPDNVQVDVTMKFGEPFKQGENNGRPWYLWTVQNDAGDDASLFADEPLQMLLEAADIERGDEISIKPVKTTKAEREKGTPAKNNNEIWRTAPKEPQQEQQQKPQQKPQQEQRQEPQQEPQQEPPKAAPPKRDSLTYSDRVNLMGSCIQDAALIWAAVRTEGDSSRAIAAIANTLFIDCRKDRTLTAPDYSEPDTSGVTSDPGIQEGDPGHGEPPNPGTENDDDLPF
tara:strand:- start:372 stop:1079 length:708 start_codon:yes stop_codon:yes gene_type:complete